VNFALEGLVTIGHRRDQHVTRTEGLYLIEVRQRLPRASRNDVQTFLTYGGVGYHARVTQEPFVFVRPDGVSFPQRGWRYREFEWPYAAAFGVCAQWELHRHVAFRADAQVITFLWFPLGSRLSGGVSIPLGRYERR
jgi:hypothetical protein